MQLRYKLILAILFSLLIIIGCKRDVINEPIDNNIPPFTPSDLQVYAAYDGQVGIEWRKNSEINIIGYKIYRSINKPENFKFIQQTSDNYFIDYYLEYDSTYYYKISAVNTSNLESPLTNFVSAKPINFYIPLAPYYVRINARNWSTGTSIILYWDPPSDTDIKGYTIYRSTTSGFNSDTSHYYDFTVQNSYTDNKNISTLTKYYYRIKAVDKGNLKSAATSEVSDVILNSPILIFPDNNSAVKSITEFRFRAVALPAKYKLVIQSNLVFGTIEQFDLVTDKVDQEIVVTTGGLQLESSKSYVWRVYTYTNSEIDPNSYSEYFAFTYNPY